MAVSNRKLTIVLMATIAVSAFASAAWWNPAWFWWPSYPLQNEYTLDLVVRNNSPRFMRTATFEVLAPVKQTSFQKVLNITATADYELVVDDYGNQVMRFTLPNFPPFGQRPVHISFQVAQAETLNFASHAGLQQFLGSQPLVPVEDPLVIQTAQQISANTENYPKSVHEWLNTRIESSNVAMPDKGALYALQALKGDCSEFMYAFVALLRAREFSARGMAGFKLLPDRRLISGNYHNWAEYYQRGQWHLSDAQQGNFDTHVENYLAFKILTNTPEATTGKTKDAQQLLFFAHPLRVTFN